MPISNGICEWTGDAAYKSYSNSSVDIEQEEKLGDYNNWSEDTKKGRGWFMSASLNSSGRGASASVSPSIYGVDPDTGKPEPFTEAVTYGGTANVSAHINAVRVSYCQECGLPHFWAGDSDSNKNKQRSMWAKVITKEVEIWRMKGYEITKKKGHKVTGGLEAKTIVKVVDVSVSAGYEWTTEEGKTFREEEREKDKRNELEVGDSQGQTASVSQFWSICLKGWRRGTPRTPIYDFKYHPAPSGASLDFIFEGHSSNNSVSYTP